METNEGFRTEEGQSPTKLLPAPGLRVRTGQRMGPQTSPLSAWDGEVCGYGLKDELTGGPLEGRPVLGKAQRPEAEQCVLRTMQRGNRTGPGHRLEVLGSLAGVSRAGVHPDLGVPGSRVKLVWGTCWQEPSWQCVPPGSVDSELD